MKSTLDLEANIKIQQSYVNTLSTERTKLKVDKRNRKATDIAKKIVETHKNDPVIKKLKEGEMLVISRRSELAKKMNLKTSVLVIRRGDNFEYVTKFHKTSYDAVTGKAKASKRSKIEEEGLQKEYRRGGLNRLNYVDRGNMTLGLERKSIAGVQTCSPYDERAVEATRQQKTEAAFVGNPFLLTPSAVPTNQTEATFAKSNGIFKPTTASIYEMHQGNAIDVFRESSESVSPTSGIDLGNPVPPQAGIDFLFTNALGMTMMHAKHIAHGDNSLKNKLVARDGHAVQADFGTNKHLTNPTQTGPKESEINIVETAGTPIWNAPDFSSAMAMGMLGNDRVQTYAIEPSQTMMTSPAKAPKAAEKLYVAADLYVESINAFEIMTGRAPQNVHDRNVANVPRPRLMDLCADLHRGDDKSEELFSQNPEYAKRKKALDEAKASNDEGRIKEAQKAFNALPEAQEYVYSQDVKKGLQQAEERGYPKALTDLTFRGMSSNPAERPRMIEIALAAVDYASPEMKAKTKEMLGDVMKNDPVLAKFFREDDAGKVLLQKLNLS